MLCSKEFKRPGSYNVDRYDIQYYNPDSAEYGLIILGVAVGSNAYMRHRLSVKFDEMKVLTQNMEEFALVSVSDTKIRKDSKGYLRQKVYNYRQVASILLESVLVRRLTSC